MLRIENFLGGGEEGVREWSERVCEGVRRIWRIGVDRCVSFETCLYDWGLNSLAPLFDRCFKAEWQV